MTRQGQNGAMPFCLPQCLEGRDSDQALDHLRTYYGRPYTGAYFDTWAPAQNDPNAFTPDDLLAVSFLSVVVPPLAARQLLDVQAAEFAALLRQVGADRDLADQAEAVTEGEPVCQLYRAVRRLPGVGRTIGTKVLARKRPRLMPIYDSVVARISGKATTTGSRCARLCGPTVSTTDCSTSASKPVWVRTCRPCACWTSSRGWRARQLGFGRPTPMSCSGSR